MQMLAYAAAVALVAFGGGAGCARIAERCVDANGNRCSPPWVEGAPDMAGDTRLAAFPWPPELLVQTIGESDLRRVVVPGVECPDPDRAVRALWPYLAGRVTVRPDGSVRLRPGRGHPRREADAAKILTTRGGCLHRPGR